MPIADWSRLVWTSSIKKLASVAWRTVGLTAFLECARQVVAPNTNATLGRSFAVDYMPNNHFALLPAIAATVAASNVSTEAM